MRRRSLRPRQASRLGRRRGQSGNRLRAPVPQRDRGCEPKRRHCRPALSTAASHPREHQFLSLRAPSLNRLVCDQEGMSSKAGRKHALGVPQESELGIWSLRPVAPRRSRGSEWGSSTSQCATRRLPQSRLSLGDAAVDRELLNRPRDRRGATSRRTPVHLGSGEGQPPLRPGRPGRAGRGSRTPPRTRLARPC